MKPILDVTAGNRLLWRRKEGKPHVPPHVIFLDKEYDLLIPPDIFADFTHLPFRDDVFSTAIFDPPYGWTIPPFMNNLKSYQRKEGTIGNTFYGRFENKRKMRKQLYQAQKELARVADILCFKWNEYRIPIWKILTLFSDWIITNTKEHVSRKRRSRHKTFWVTMSREAVL